MNITPIDFPDVSTAPIDAPLAMGGKLSLDYLVSAYVKGIFPWSMPQQPLLWWSPDPRTVLFPERVRISKSLAKQMRSTQFQQHWQVTCNHAFAHVISNCAFRGQHSREQTWISDDMHKAYCQLHHVGYAHSIEVWHDKELVGGLYGVCLGDVFFGESMFSRANNASKIALVYLCYYLVQCNVQIVDCQVTSQHLLSMGAQEISRSEFLRYLDKLEPSQINADFKQGFTRYWHEKPYRDIFSR